MLRHAAQRIALAAVPVLFGVLLVGFLLMQVVPTDPAVVRAGPTASAEVVEQIRRDLGLDQPIWVQFGLYLWRLCRATSASPSSTTSLWSGTGEHGRARRSS
jgi:ABC-type dipeptide/oligopeptide/nickel transport system permease component